MSSRARTIAQAGAIAAVYAALTLVAIQYPLGLGYGPVQFRLSEAVTVVACLTPAAIPGLWLGAIIANSFMLGQFGILAMFDVIFGSLGSLLGAVWTWRFRGRPVLALAGPVVANALIVPAYLPLMLAGTTGLDFYRVPLLGLDMSQSWLSMYVLGVIGIAIGEAVVVYALGLPLLLVLRRLGVARALGDGAGQEQGRGRATDSNG